MTDTETGFSPAQEMKDDKYWVPSGLNKTNYSDVVADAMLKSIEEPPSNVTFIFLTNNKDDLISTVVSRSQAFYVPDYKHKEYNTEFFEKFFTSYPTFNKNRAFELAECLYTYQNSNDLSPTYILDCIQYYLIRILKSNYENEILKRIIYKDTEKIEESKKMINSHIKEQTVYEDLAFYFEKR